MAKAQQIPFRIAEDDAEVWVANVLRVRFDEVLKHREAALDPRQTEGVHQMRVAIRRLRAVIRDFSAISDIFAFRHLRKKLKRLADSLGAVRDADVLINAVSKLSERPGAPSGQGMDDIIASYREKRELARTHLEIVLSDDFIDDLRSRFQEEMDASLCQRELFRVSDVGEAARVVILRCLEDFIRQSDAIYQPLRVKPLHRLRIAGKHLRYAIELFSESSAVNIAEFAQEVARMQGYLGDLHDCDVWISDLSGRLRRKRPRHHDTADGRHAYAWLLSEFSRSRTKAYREALDLWTIWEASEFEEKLRSALAPEHDTGRSRPSAA